MRVHLPKEPVDLFEISFLVLEEFTVEECKLVYHRERGWEDACPGTGAGADLRDEWLLFVDGKLSSRYTGWKYPVDREWYTNFVSLEEAHGSLVEGLKALLASTKKRVLSLEKRIQDLEKRKEH